MIAALPSVLLGMVLGVILSTLSLVLLHKLLFSAPVVEPKRKYRSVFLN